MDKNDGLAPSSYTGQTVYTQPRAGEQPKKRLSRVPKKNYFPLDSIFSLAVKEAEF
jgi:hypothetical protein